MGCQSYLVTVVFIKTQFLATCWIKSNILLLVLCWFFLNRPSWKLHSYIFGVKVIIMLWWNVFLNELSKTFIDEKQVRQEWLGWMEGVQCAGLTNRATKFVPTVTCKVRLRQLAQLNSSTYRWTVCERIKTTIKR